MTDFLRTTPHRGLAGAILTAAVAASASVLGSTSAGAAPVLPASVLTYDSHSAAEYAAKWSAPYGPLDGVVPQVSADGAATLSDVLFKPGTDLSVSDHLTYLAVSSRTFAAPAPAA